MSNRRHLKRLNTPKSWPIKKKENRYVARPRPGPHKLRECIPLSLLLKNVLKYAKTTREVKKILSDKKLLIDKKFRKDPNFPIGLMDIIEFPEINEYYRVLIDQKGTLMLNKITKQEANHKTCKIIGKTYLKKKKIQLNLYDGKNILIDKDEYKVGDSVIIDLEKNKVVKHIKLEKGASIFLIDGGSLGKFGILDEIKIQEGSLPPRVIFTIDKDKAETRKDFVYVVDKSIIPKK
ncbi:MAG: 30S ribosomal protein S4e [Candidatus Nanoarchaeia archaeon]|nr:30S ribosomal protein S4e [Candidatus Nanoarchaeia archaeon]